MNTNCHPQNIIMTEGSPALRFSPEQAQPWYVVRAGLLVTLAALLGVLGVVIACPSVVDLTLAVMR
jgi:hypothetical protein